jgi:hypothetical protein
MTRGHCIDPRRRKLLEAANTLGAAIVMALWRLIEVVL